MLSLRFLLIIFLFLAAFTSAISQTIFIQEDDSETQAILSITEKLRISNSKDTIIEGFFSNDTLAYSYKIFKNKPSGRYKVYHPNSKIKYLSVFINGQLNGSWKEFNNKGKLIISGSYKNGKKDGTWLLLDKKRVEVYSDGTATGRWRIDEGWTPRTLYKYKNGVLIETKFHFPQKDVFY